MNILSNKFRSFRDQSTPAIVPLLSAIIDIEFTDRYTYQASCHFGAYLHPIYTISSLVSGFVRAVITTASKHTGRGPISPDMMTFCRTANYF